MELRSRRCHVRMPGRSHALTGPSGDPDEKGPRKPQVHVPASLSRHSIAVDNAVETLSPSDRSDSAALRKINGDLEMLLAL